jgi:hypothetical protein
VATTATPGADELGAPYGPAGRPAWIDTDWRAHLRWVRVDVRAFLQER